VGAAGGNRDEYGIVYSRLKGTTRIVVKLLGEGYVFNSGTIVYPPFNFFRILTFMLVNGQDRPVSRRNLGNLIWSDSPSEQVNADFRQTLARINRFQKEHDFKLLAADATAIWLNRGQDVYIDLMEFYRLMANPGPKSWLRLCEVYRGDLLGIHRSAGEEFEEWLEHERQLARSGFVSAMSQALMPGSGLTNPERQVVASRLLREDPYNEGAYRALMYVAAGSGDQSLIRRLFDACTAILHKELGVTPTAETVNYYKLLMARDYEASPITLESEQQVARNMLTDR